MDECRGLSDEIREGLTPHVLRHTFASHLAQHGASLHEIARLLGQSSVWVTERYSHLQDDAGRKAIALLDEYSIGENPGGSVHDAPGTYCADLLARVVSITSPRLCMRIAS